MVKGWTMNEVVGFMAASGWRFSSKIKGWLQLLGLTVIFGYSNDEQVIRGERKDGNHVHHLLKVP